MKLLDKAPFKRATAAFTAVVLTMGLAPAAMAAPADDLVAGSADLQTQAAASPIDVTMTVSNAGTLALARQDVTVSDANADGKITVDEALTATHEKFYSGGKSGFATADSSYGGKMITKIWGTETTNTTFRVNDELKSTSVDATAVSAGDDLYAALNADNTYWSDHYAFFDKKELSVNANESFTLNLKASAWGDPMVAPNVKIGTWADGKFTALSGKTTDAKGAVSLSFDEPGTYVVSASGTVSDDVMVDYTTYATEKMDCPITAPVCVVTVIADNPMTVKAVAAKKIPAATYGKAKTIAAAKAIAVNKAQGDVTYKKASGNKKITVAKNGKIKVAKGIAAGTYKVKVAVTAAGNDLYKKATKNATVTITVKKAANTMKVKASAKTVKLAKVAKKAATVAPLKVTKALGTKSFKVTKWTSKNAKKYVKVNAKNGKVTVAKGTPKGTYKFKVKITAKGNKNYAAKNVTKAVTVKVK